MRCQVFISNESCPKKNHSQNEHQIWKNKYEHETQYELYHDIAKWNKSNEVEKLVDIVI